MEFQALLDRRRSTRRFDATRDVPEDVLRAVLAAPLAMPHACNAYDWRAVVLRRRTRDPQRWPAIFEALYRQSYIEEAAVVMVWAVQPGWFASTHRAAVADLVEQGLVHPERAGDLLEVIAGGFDLGARDVPGSDAAALVAGLIGEAMLGVGAAMLAALDAGLGATVTACRPVAIAEALSLPAHAVVAPFGVLALGYPVPGAAGGPGGGATKPAVADMYFEGVWAEPLTLGSGQKHR